MGDQCIICISIPAECRSPGLLTSDSLFYTWKSFIYLFALISFVVKSSILDATTNTAELMTSKLVFQITGFFSCNLFSMLVVYSLGIPNLALPTPIVQASCQNNDIS